jgi:hypothetical protein
VSLRTFILVGGSFNEISVFPDPIKIGTKSLLAKIANVFMVLVSAVVQPRDLGFGEDMDCGALIAGLQQKDPHGIVLEEGKKPRGSKTVPAKRGR